MLIRKTDLFVIYSCDDDDDNKLNALVEAPLKLSKLMRWSALYADRDVAGQFSDSVYR